MKSINEFINETKFQNKFDKNNVMLLWFKVWSKLSSDGPMTKKEVLKALGKKETSYSGMFAEMTARGIIAPDKSKRGALKAIPEEQWDLDAISWHEIPGAETLDRLRKADLYYDFDEKKNNFKLKQEYRDKPGEASEE
jgi:hypothetical protein